MAVLFSIFAQPSDQISSIDLKSPFNNAKIDFPSVPIKIHIFPIDSCTTPDICSQTLPITSPKYPHFSCKLDNFSSFSPSLAINKVIAPTNNTIPCGPDNNAMALLNNPKPPAEPAVTPFNVLNRITALPPTVKSFPTTISNGPTAATTNATFNPHSSNSGLSSPILAINSVTFSTMFLNAGSIFLYKTKQVSSKVDFKTSKSPPRLSFIILANSDNLPFEFSMLSVYS